MSSEEQTKVVSETKEPTTLSFEVLSKRIDDLEAENKALKDIIVDTQKVVRTNFTTNKSNEPENNKYQEHKDLEKKLYSNLKIKTN